MIAGPPARSGLLFYAEKASVTWYIAGSIRDYKQRTVTANHRKDPWAIYKQDVFPFAKF
jgi:hypothetical protein